MEPGTHKIGYFVTGVFTVMSLECDIVLSIFHIFFKLSINYDF